MQVKYRGYTIEVQREKCLGGWYQLYMTIVRDSDKYLAVDTFSDSSETVREMIQILKNRIDGELEEKDPWGELSQSYYWNK